MLFRPFHRIRIRVIDQLIRGRRVQFNGRSINRYCTLRLSTKRVSSFLKRVTSFRLQGGLLNAPFVVPHLFIFRSRRRFIRTKITKYFRTPFVFLGRLCNEITIVGTNLRRHRFFKVFQTLFRVARTWVTTRNSFSFIMAFLANRSVRRNNFSQAILNCRSSTLSFYGTRECTIGGSRITRQLNRIFCLWV